MDHEAEVIKSQMEETRSSLAEKLETLESQVLGTVQQTTAAVSNTVEAVKSTVQSVKGAVEETVEKAKGSVHETVETIQESLDIPRQVQRHPWGMFTGSVALGFLTGYLLSTERRRIPGYRAMGNGAVPRRGPLTEEFLEATSAGYGPETPAHAAAPSQPSAFSKVSHALAGELGKLKGLAIGTTLGLVRDLVTDRLPESVRTDVNNMVNEVTEKLGGKVLPSPVLGEFQRPAAPAAPETRFTQPPSAFQR
jgi:ElaB/YqjD/DUF883 family membrane-anchored ribosome-binding protein